ncbi:uncharacterized protein NECHADRAFT_87112 [Fusarium vanettenii 77-13-4]|uniref:Uncharacterized protein n=1 Tax=Fusarium vanettenii (strain ATCC MYA-4622 / CBS 123669 / FGSC 9596 / NRRL 45880 / 77-13-4) TaxID=660122 RepID=C7ZIE3_FUSV7|nr:uncharacterized protein NECHADRAFT_87112 [Fusarium vanettenii 77-13-4]EEU36246.1 hypothetical protein NECHADRAFT_87112 [Fusarium vanettenii 77-13-4]
MDAPYLYPNIRHEERLIDGTLPDLQPGEAVCRSHSQPSLQGGVHTINVSQELDAAPAPKEDKEFGTESSRDFEVVAPHYSLPASSLDSVFPMVGDGASPKTLPHVVLKDPHFPWKWPASKTSTTSKVNKQKGCIPWVALNTFTADELQLDSTTLESITKFPDVRANDNLSFRFPVARINDMKTEMIDNGSVTNLMMSPASREAKDDTAAICIPGELFRQLFADENGICHINQFQYLSHVRKVATDGMVSSVDGESGLYSIIVSHRTGPLDTAVPVPMSAHLVSIENIENLDMAKVKPHVLMTSLYSWSYTSLPAGSSNEMKALRILGRSGFQLLRPPPAQGTSQSKGIESRTLMEDVTAKRQQEGYTLMRYRTVTGELTVAIYRGPLIPTPVTYNIRPPSNFGTDLQILDPELSLMDISYSSAWQLGRTLGMSDAAFTSALSRIRALIQSKAADGAKRDGSHHLRAYKSRDDAVASIGRIVSGLGDMNNHLHANQSTTSSTNRWKEKPVPEILSEKGAPFKDHEVPNNTDFHQVYNWVLDKLHLAHIPAHYLITDPSYLQPESLRFFFIDENWTRALVDGALSLANHWGSEPDRDYARSALKTSINACLATPHEKVGNCQQVPKYGFLLRSQVLVQFTDLKVKATFARANTAGEDESMPKASILVQRMLESDIMLCLFNQTPPDLESIELTLPPHQQSFAVGEDITPWELKVAFRNTVATQKPSTEWPSRQDAISRETYSAPTCPVFDWPSRTLRPTEYARRVFEHQRHTDKETPGFFEEAAPTSALLALQLNELPYTLKIAVKVKDDPKKDASDTSFTKVQHNRNEPWPYGALSLSELPSAPTPPILLD